MVQYRFRLTGVPPDQAIKEIEVDPDHSIVDIKKSVQREYKLNPILAIQFIFKGKVLPDTLKFAKIGIHPKKDVITVMATQAGGASRLEMVLKELNDNGNFRASLFSTSTGLVLASQKDDDVDERVVAAMGSLLSDAAIKAAEEMHLSEAKVMKIFYKSDYIICRSIILNDGKTQFLLAVLARLPESDDVERYFDQLLNWAVQNAQGDLEKLSTI
ncbi:MAG TPA: ubiquitin-like protein [Candidatus Lokiarchaeia archaeon]